MVIVSVPSKAGNPLPDQLFFVPQLASTPAPPPSQVVPATAGSARIIAQKNGAALRGIRGIKPLRNGGRRDIAAHIAASMPFPPYLPQMTLRNLLSAGVS